MILHGEDGVGKKEKSLVELVAKCGLREQEHCLVACKHKFRFFLEFLQDCGSKLASGWIL